MSHICTFYHLVRQTGQQNHAEIQSSVINQAYQEKPELFPDQHPWIIVGAYTHNNTIPVATV